jgi:hypothetical protein
MIFGAQKPKLIPKIKCIILLEQFYCMYYNIRPKNVPKGVTVVCFHLSHVITNLYHKLYDMQFVKSKTLLKSKTIVLVSTM